MKTLETQTETTELSLTNKKQKMQRRILSIENKIEEIDTCQKKSKKKIGQVKGTYDTIKRPNLQMKN